MHLDLPENDTPDLRFRVNPGNQIKTAIAKLEEAGLEKRRIWPLQEQFEDLLEDDDFWAHQANRLAILAIPDRITTFRLANELTDLAEVSDRFHLKPLLRALSFGGIESLLVNFAFVTKGLIDEKAGAVTFDDAGDAVNYGVVDEIAGRAMRTGAKVPAVRKADIPVEKELAAILRYPI